MRFDYPESVMDLTIEELQEACHANTIAGKTILLIGILIFTILKDSSEDKEFQTGNRGKTTCFAE